MSEPDDDKITTPPPKKREKGHATVAFEATQIVREAERERRAEESAKDDKQEARLDAANEKALAAESKRADDAVDAAIKKDENWGKVLAGKDKTVTRQWYVIGLLVAVIVAFAGYKIVASPTSLSIDGSTATVEAPAP